MPGGEPWIPSVPMEDLTGRCLSLWELVGSSGVNMICYAALKTAQVTGLGAAGYGL